MSLAAFALLAANSASTVTGETATCKDNLPVHQLSCTLNLQPGDEAEFECANPQPTHFPTSIYNWEGDELNVADVLGQGSEIIKVQGNKYKLKVSSNATAAAGGMTCTKASRIPSQEPGSKSPEELAIHSLVIRVSGGPEYTREGVAETSAAYDLGGNALLTSVFLGAAALALRL